MSPALACDHGDRLATDVLFENLALGIDVVLVPGPDAKVVDVEVIMAEPRDMREWLRPTADAHVSRDGNPIAEPNLVGTLPPFRREKGMSRRRDHLATRSRSNREDARVRDGR